MTDAVAVRRGFGNDYGSFRITGPAPLTGGVRIPGGQSTGCSTLYIERWYGGAGHRELQRPCAFSRLVPLKHFAPGGRYRLTVHYAPPAQGARTTGAWGTWTYLTVRRG